MAPAAFWRAWSIWVVSVAAYAAASGYNAIHPLPAKLANDVGSAADGVVGAVFIGAFATVGALLAWKRPENPIGWLLSAVGLVFAVAGFGVFLVRFPRTLTLANWLGFLYLLGFGLCVFVVLLFPNGKLPSRRWRPVAWAAGAAWPGGPWATRSLPRSSRPAGRCGTRSAWPGRPGTSSRPSQWAAWC